jgi:hypothetical protein
MKFIENAASNGGPMKPYFFELTTGYLVGAEHAKAPCRKCVSLWLTTRNVKHTPIAELPIRGDILQTLKDVNHPAVLFEVDKEGTLTRMECRLQKHPKCDCKAKGFVEYPASKLNYAFSSILQLKCARYTTPSGNVWLAMAKDADDKIALAVDTTRESARKKAVALIDKTEPNKLDLLQNEVLAKYSQLCKNPMLVVGSNNWIRTKVPFFLLQQYDVHLFFYPNSNAAWVFGACAISRVNAKAVPVWSYAAGQNSEKTLTEALFGLIPGVRPTEWGDPTFEQAEQNEKLGVWFQNWVYRSPKVALKDMLHLEPYAAEALDEYKPSKIVPVARPVMRLVIGGKQSEYSKAG